MVAERRRFWRAALAESTRVELKPTTNDKPLSIQSDLLNISPDGIACRVAGSDIDALLIGEPVELSFTLSGTARACALTGVICNKTPTGSGENVIVGMQFVMRPDVPDDQVVVDLIRKTIYANQVASGREDTVH